MKGQLNHYHFIAIGGSVMSQLAITLAEYGHKVTGSDDEIFDPSKTMLAKFGILPEKMGWDTGKIVPEIDTVILGMHAAEDNPELQKARELNLPVMSFPQFIHEIAKHKQRIVIGGSHGKTTIVAMIMHVLRDFGKDFDFLVGSQVEGFEHSVKLTDAPMIILEGDEYLSSRLDPTPKFINYHHHIGVLNGIAWDHINVYPTFDEYLSIFDAFADQTPKAGTLILNEEDSLVAMIGKKERADVTVIEYGCPSYEVVDGTFHLIHEGSKYPLQLMGRHNMVNLQAAMKVCERVGVPLEFFVKSIQTFTGASKRMELVAQSRDIHVFFDYAHAPSKVRATINALKETFPKNKLTVILELHTFSSLTEDFLPQYEGTTDAADRLVIFTDQEKLALRGNGEDLQASIHKSFHHPSLHILREVTALESLILDMELDKDTIVFMSSGNFGGLNVYQMAQKLIEP